MRIVVTSSAMAGHFDPLVPFLDAVRHGGHEVLLVAPETVREHAGAAGVPLRVGASPEPDELALLWRRFRDAGRAEASVIANREIFGRRNTAAMLPSVRRAVADHDPDIVLHEVTEYAGPVAAMEAGIRHTQVAISLAAVEHGSLDVAAPALEEYGPVVAGLRTSPYLTRFPSAIDPSPYRDTRRYREPARDAEPLPDWWGGSTEPLVYVTFGTVAGTVGTGVYRAAAEALADLPVRVLMTTGQDLGLGVMPPRICIRRWVDQHDVLAQASAVVCHGGSGTVLGALAAGLPMVVIPMFADQTRNARALEALGTATILEPGGRTAADRAGDDPRAVTALREAVERILHDRAPGEAARAVAAGIRTLPSPADLLRTLR